MQSILDEGKDILVRDVTVLGFPALSIAIPGMSEISFDANATYFNIFVAMQKLLKDMRNINLSNLNKVIAMMETIVNEIGYEKLSILISLQDNSMLPCEQMGNGAKYFLAICYIMNEEYNTALESAIASGSLDPITAE